MTHPISSMLWRRLDLPGHETAVLAQHAYGWQLTGAAVFLYDGQPCRLDYAVDCDPAWYTASAQVTGWVGSRKVGINLKVHSGRRWQLNGIESREVESCIDLDLNFSPSTNLLPIRRLNLEVGQQASVRAAWLRFPGFEIEPLEQTYLRLSTGTYRYESSGGQFTADLRVNPDGFVIEYPNLWEAEGK